jgi:hypothetical protein
MPGNKFSSFLYATTLLSSSPTVFMTLKVSISFVVTLYISRIQNYVVYFNVYILYMLHRCLKIFSVEMAHTIYLLVCGL